MIMEWIKKIIATTILLFFLFCLSYGMASGNINEAIKCFFALIGLGILVKILDWSTN